jgi:ParB family chromosome partitioning protein
VAKEKVSKQRLGKGLSALIPGADQVDEGTSRRVREIRIDTIKPNPYQPRMEIDDEKLDELVDSIKRHGIIQPVVVRETDEGYELVAGHRRCLAAKKLKMATIPAVVEDLPDIGMMQIALIENIQRQDLNPIEEATAYQRLIDEFGLTQEDIADVIGKSRPAVANTLRLLNLPKQIQESVSRGTISAGHAKCLLSLDGDVQIKLWEEIIATGMSVRDAEEAVKQIKAGKKKDHKDSGVPVRMKKTNPQVVELEETLRRYFGTQVKIKQGPKKGYIEIEYYSPEDLERILGLFLQ